MIKPAAPLPPTLQLVLLPAPTSVVSAPPVSFVHRAMAHMLDMTIIQGFSSCTAKWGALGFLALLQNFYGVKGSGNPVVLDQLFSYAYWSIWIAGTALASLCYFVGLTHAHGKTFGQAFFELKVEGVDGRAPCFWTSFRRYGLGILSYVSLGLFWWSRHQDSWSKTRVVSSQATPEIN